MQVKLYLDVIFLINFIADCFVLICVNVLLHLHTKFWRIVLGGFAGSVALLFFIIHRWFLYPVTSAFIYIGISLGANIICFGLKKGFFSKWLLSTTIMVLIGSCMNYIKYMTGLSVLHFGKWLLCFFAAESTVFILLMKLIPMQKHSKQMYTVIFKLNNRRTSQVLYMDTGNFLWDPMFQKPVIILNEKCMDTCFTVDEYRLLKEYFDTGILNYKSLHSSEMQMKYCFHEISYESVGRKKGKLLCFLMDEVEIIEGHKKLYRQPVALVQESLFYGKLYQGLLQPDCISL